MQGNIDIYFNPIFNVYVENGLQIYPLIYKKLKRLITRFDFVFESNMR